MTILSSVVLTQLQNSKSLTLKLNVKDIEDFIEVRLINIPCLRVYVQMSA